MRFLSKLKDCFVILSFGFLGLIDASVHTLGFWYHVWMAIAMGAGIAVFAHLAPEDGFWKSLFFAWVTSFVIIMPVWVAIRQRRGRD